ncbi:MAG: Fe-Mn family superoxide dismutase [Patescibacteria group bacterium]
MADYQAQPYDEKLDKLTGISKDTSRAHYGLYEKYVAAFNKAMKEKAEASREDANQIGSAYRSAQMTATFALGGIKNHEIYFGHLGGDGGAIEGEFKKQIEKDFSSWDEYLKDLAASGMAGRGWAWTIWDDDCQALYNCIGDAQDTFPIWNAHPVVALDVYEHAYMADFSTARPKYIDAFLENMDWSVVESSFKGIHG